MATEINIAFSVSASGAQPMTFQWQSGSTNLVDTSRITGSLVVTSSYSQSLFINNVQESDTGSYRVVVSNNDGTVVSNYAALNIVYHLYPPLVIVQPTDQIVPDGYTASFSASVIGTPPISYQWYSGSTVLVDDGRITGSQTAFLYFSSIVPGDSGSYRLLAANSTSSTYSNFASLSFVPREITSSVFSSTSFTIGLSVGSLVDADPIPEIGNTVVVGIVSGSLTTAIFELSESDSASFETGLYSSSVYQTIFTGSNFDSTSFETGLYSSSVYQTIFTGSNFDSASFETGLYSSSVYTVITVYEIPAENLTSITVGLMSGSLEG